MHLGRGGLQILLNTHAVELRFKRRIQLAGFNSYRRMFCTNDQRLLQSEPGKRVLNYEPPTGRGLKYSPAAKNLVVTWDIFMQAWRMINCNDVDVISVIKTTPPDDFWKYFYNQLNDMSSVHKARFQNT